MLAMMSSIKLCHCKILYDINTACMRKAFMQNDYAVFVSVLHFVL